MLFSEYLIGSPEFRLISAWLTYGWESCHSWSWLSASEITPEVSAAIKLNERRQALNRKTNKTHKRDTKWKKERPSWPGRQEGSAQHLVGTLSACPLAGVSCFLANSWERGRKNADVIEMETGESAGPLPVLGSTFFFFWQGLKNLKC